MTDPSLKDAQARDKRDPLGIKRQAFVLPDDVIYLDGNSLGPLTKRAQERIDRTVSAQWGKGLIRSWNDAGWIDLPREVGKKIAPLIGAAPDTVVMADSTSVNLFKVLSAACALRKGRSRLVTEKRNFPTDNYIAEGVIEQLGRRHTLTYVDKPEDIPSVLTEDVAVVFLTHVNYRDGRMHDIEAITKAAHDVGALIVWDLAHSAGAVPLELDRAGVDFAVGCTYKYLNGGPGSPAFVYVSPNHLGDVHQPLSGWFAHAAPFDFDPVFDPAKTINQFLCGTPPVLSTVALDAALDIWADVDIHQIREKSLALTDYFIELVETRCQGKGLTLITPREHSLRGSQVSFTHPEAGYPIMAALIANGVIGDFRAPDIMRFGFTPLYTSFSDVWLAVDKLATILEDGSWDQPAFHARKAVT